MRALPCLVHKTAQSGHPSRTEPFNIGSDPRYLAFAVFTEELEAERHGSASSSGPLHVPRVPPNFATLLPSLVAAEDFSLVWIEQLCRSQHSREGTRQSDEASIKDIYTKAAAVVIWTGIDHESADEECFDVYLGRGGTETMQHAFKSARALAHVPVHSVKMLQLINTARHSATGLQSWGYLFRILCRLLFHGLPLLRTNYFLDLRNATVRCGTCDVALMDLWTAAMLIRIVFPLPYFIRNSRVRESEDEDNLRADRRFLEKCMWFGLQTQDFAARIQWPFRDADNDYRPTNPRFFAHIGYCEDLYSIAKRAPLCKHAMSRVSKMEEEPVAYILGAFDSNLQQPKALWTYPASSPFAGALAKPPPAAYQAFVVPRLQKLFLRLARGHDGEINLFMWNLCMLPEVRIDSRDDVDHYVFLKHLLMQKNKAQVINIYEVLEAAGRDRTLEELRELGLPPEMSWEDWLTELNA